MTELFGILTSTQIKSLSEEQLQQILNYKDNTGTINLFIHNFKIKINEDNTIFDYNLYDKFKKCVLKNLNKTYFIIFSITSIIIRSDNYNNYNKIVTIADLTDLQILDEKQLMTQYGNCFLKYVNLHYQSTSLSICKNTNYTSQSARFSFTNQENKIQQEDISTIINSVNPMIVNGKEYIKYDCDLLNKFFYCLPNIVLIDKYILKLYNMNKDFFYGVYN
jgi:hypothetical protein